MPIYRVKPVIPRDAADPANQRGNLGRAMRELKRRFKAIEKSMVQLVGEQSKYRKVSAANSARTVEWHPLVYFTNAKGELDTVKCATAINKTYYEYQIDTDRYNQIDNFIQRMLYESILESLSGDKPPRWFFQSYLTTAFNDGVADALQSAKNQAEPDVVGQQITQQVRAIGDDAYSPQIVQALGLVHARVFNEMEGLSDGMKADLSRTLRDGMANGFGIREITADIKKRVNVGFSRAQRIARTEILQAYRTAQRARTKEINETVYDDSPFIMRQLWFSALAATSRPWHVSRHGNVYTQQEVERFYSERANSINCLCSQSPVLVSRKTGEPVNQALIDRMKKQKERWRG